jgi:hypothetical protein
MTSVAYLSPHDIAGIVPGGKHPSNVIRWIVGGLLVHGVRVRLRAERVGGRWQVRPEDLEAFRAATDTHGRDAPLLPVPASAFARVLDRRGRRRQRLAKAELHRLGVM